METYDIEDEKSIKEFLESVERFDIKTEIKTQKAVSKLLKAVCDDDVLSEVELFQCEHVAAMDPANVAMLVCKSPRMKLACRRFISKENEVKLPNIEHKNIGSAKYNFEYLEYFNKIMKAAGHENYIFEMSEDYPLSISCDDFELILAPRVDKY